MSAGARLLVYLSRSPPGTAPPPKSSTKPNTPPVPLTLTAAEKAEIAARRRRLADCATYLKEEFIGIDGIIDEVISYLHVWYLMPELLTRPIIINLWGMTGVGKTDLIRKLVKFLHFQDRFVEVELGASGQGSGYVSSVGQILTNNRLSDGKPAVILFDEIQRFRTVNADGSPNRQTRYVDFWELLSDGRLSRKNREDLDNYLFDYLRNRRRREQEAATGGAATQVERDAAPESPNANLESWDADSLRNVLGLDLTVEQFASLTEADVIRLILSAREDKRIYEPVDHSRTLIFISGNLDEAYEMAGQASEADVSADIYHAFTNKITVVDIKDALLRKFRPEQVARFGNIHLIYRSLTQENFRELIHREITTRTGRIAERYGVRVSVSKSVEDLIYRNGVFPVQGVRPVFSSIVDILESNWTPFLFRALLEEEDRFSVDYDPDGRALLFTLGEVTERVPYVGRVDRVRQAGRRDVVASISVHECGHAVVYLALTGMVPLQLKSQIASSTAGGFTFPHEIYATKASTLDKIRIFLAGGLAEELVFGPEAASTGRSDDRVRATALAVEYVRKYAFDRFAAVYNLHDEHLRMNADPTDRHVEQLIATAADETRALLRQHKPLLVELSLALAAAGSLPAATIAAVAERHGMAARIEEEGFVHVADFAARLAGQQ